MLNNEALINKWKPVLEHGDLPKIADPHKRAVTAAMLENTEIALQENGGVVMPQLLGESTPAANVIGDPSSTGQIKTFDPVLISLVRRALPNLIAYDIAGVQPMTGPTGLIFAMRARYASQTGNEAFYQEANTAFASQTNGSNTAGQGHFGTIPGSAANTSAIITANVYNYGGGVKTANAEAWGNSTVAIPEMAFSIEKVTVTAKSRALKAEYTLELAQDLKAIHGLDAETELSNILSAEILAEINREVVRTINTQAKRGATEGTVTPGRFDLDTDSNGRWSVEKFKGLLFQIERECNQIAKATRRGKGNILICSSDVASALQMAGVLDYAPAMNSNNELQVDDTGNTFAGVLNGRLKVYIDPYAGGQNDASGQYLTVGYKGASAFDAGIFYCPYVPLQMVRAVDPDSFQPKIGFKTRYGMVANPFAGGLTQNLGVIDNSTESTNVYYRRVMVDNLF